MVQCVIAGEREKGETEVVGEGALRGGKSRKNTG